MANSITPPPELVQKLCDTAFLDGADKGKILYLWLIQEAFRAGADQELDACCEWLQDPDLNVDTYKLRAARRPKPPSLADQATAELDDAVMRGDCITTTDAMPLLRAALKRLAELEALPD